MKKIVSILLAVAMVMACAVSAFATEAEVVEIDWAEIEAQAADTVAKGEFVNFDEIALVMWVPSVLAATELTDEDRELCAGGDRHRLRLLHHRGRLHLRGCWQPQVR